MAYHSSPLIIRSIGCVPYEKTFRAMQQFTDNRTDKTEDELWLVEHPPVYTQGLAGKPEHLIHAGNIPVIQTDRGGQITYHGPGQLVAYVLLDCRRRNLGVKNLVCALERAVINLLQAYHIQATTKPTAPGVYVNDAKIASIGLRIRKGCSYHGLSLNVGMDLTPFMGINPCGYSGLKVVQISDLGGPNNVQVVSKQLVQHLASTLSYTTLKYSEQGETTEYART